MSERYTLGYGDAAMRFLLRRSLESHGAFYLPHLRPGLRVLDCGCGPGSITAGIARRVHPGHLDAIDMDASQIALAQERAREVGLDNVTYQVASVYELPYPDGQFDAIFCRNVMIYFDRDTVRRVKAELAKVLLPGGYLFIGHSESGIEKPETVETIDNAVYRKIP
jgi:ubiquinone/menaquinone biosynthesis C-methylase UbiE